MKKEYVLLISFVTNIIPIFTKVKAFHSLSWVESHAWSFANFILLVRNYQNYRIEKLFKILGQQMEDNRFRYLSTNVSIGNRPGIIKLI